MQHNMLSSIPEESSIKEMDFVTSSVISETGKDRGLHTSYGMSHAKDGVIGIEESGNPLSQ